MNAFRFSLACLSLASLVACQNSASSTWMPSPLDRPGIARPGSQASAAAAEQQLAAVSSALSASARTPHTLPAATPLPSQEPAPAFREISPAAPQVAKQSPQTDRSKPVQDGNMRVPNMLDLPADSEFRPKAPKQNDGGVTVRPPSDKP